METFREGQKEIRQGGEGGDERQVGFGLTKDAELQAGGEEEELRGGSWM